jgi:uncharacterized membrane protein YdjX (TVP38/TMEM64 family)
MGLKQKGDITRTFFTRTDTNLQLRKQLFVKVFTGFEKTVAERDRKTLKAAMSAPQPDPSNPEKPAALWTRARDFFVHMDAKQVRIIWVSLLLLSLSGLVVFLGRSALGQETLVALEGFMKAYAESPLGIMIVVVVFCIAALVGAPQFVLIAACVVAFGPWLGFAYAWVATVVSAAFTFYLGRFLGPKTFERFGGDYLQTLSQHLGKNAFVASFMIRNIPSAPFVVVNMAFGLSRASFLGFIAGCALGVVPKTALVALFGSSYEALTKGRGWLSVLIMVSLSLVWLGLVVLMKRFLERFQN